MVHRRGQPVADIEHAVKRVATLTVAAGAVAAVIVLLPPRAMTLPEQEGIAEPVRGAIHIHTRRSDGSGTVDQIAAGAARAGLRFVVLTDHGDGTRTPDLAVVPLMASSASTLSKSAPLQGHVVVLGLTGPAPYSARRRTASGHRRRCQTGRRLDCGTSGLAKRSLQLGRLETPLRWPRVAERRQRVARRAAAVTCTCAADVSAAAGRDDGNAARQAQERA